MASLYLSPEALEDIRSWDLLHVDERARVVRDILAYFGRSPTGGPLTPVGECMDTFERSPFLQMLIDQANRDLQVSPFLLTGPF